MLAGTRLGCLRFRLVGAAGAEQAVEHGGRVGPLENSPSPANAGGSGGGGLSGWNAIPDKDVSDATIAAANAHGAGSPGQGCDGGDGFWGQRPGYMSYQSAGGGGGGAGHAGYSGIPGGSNLNGGDGLECDICGMLPDSLGGGPLDPLGHLSTSTGLWVGRLPGLRPAGAPVTIPATASMASLTNSATGGK